MSVELEKILSDNLSGSITLTQNAMQYYRDYLAELSAGSSELDEIFLQFQDEAKKILKSQPNMVLLRKSTNNILIYFKRLVKSDKEQADVIKAIDKKIHAIEQDISTRIEKIANTGSRIIAPTNKLMTISNSTLVKNIIDKAHAQKRKFEVFCCKSHPPDEGVHLAEALDKSGVKTTLISDSQIGVFMPEMNLVLIGADRIYDTGIVNKVGTLSLCLMAKYFNIPVYLAVETTKILSESERVIKVVSHERNEVYEGSRKKLSVRNVYYEKIPIDLIHKVICEDSVFDTVDFINWYLKE